MRKGLRRRWAEKTRPCRSVRIRIWDLETLERLKQERDTIIFEF